MLELQDVVKHYRHAADVPVRAVDGVSMMIAAGDFVALYGPSGSGKTTLIEVIAGLKAADRGSVLFDGQEIASLTSSELDAYRLHQLGIIGGPQALIPGARAIENAVLKLLLTSTSAAEATVEPLLDELGLADRLQHRTEQLSMGERQRVLIARALSTNPRLLLADEPTGSLDTQRTLEVLALLRRVCSERGTTVLLTTHDPRAAAFADEVHELRDGRLTEYNHELLGSVVSPSPEPGQ